MNKLEDDTFHRKTCKEFSLIFSLKQMFFFQNIKKTFWFKLRKNIQKFFKKGFLKPQREELFQFEKHEQCSGSSDVWIFRNCFKPFSFFPKESYKKKNSLSFLYIFPTKQFFLNQQKSSPKFSLNDYALKRDFSCLLIAFPRIFVLFRFSEFRIPNPELKNSLMRIEKYLILSFLQSFSFLLFSFHFTRIKSIKKHTNKSQKNWAISEGKMFPLLHSYKSSFLPKYLLRWHFFKSLYPHMILRTVSSI